MNNPILISGAGPVGLVLALLLYKQGREVEIFEAVKEPAPLGVGINLLPHSVCVLHNLDLESKLDQIAIRTEALHYYNRFGQKIWDEPRGLPAGYDYPQYSIHRGHFQMMLLEEVRHRLGEEHVHMDHSLISWQEENDHISVTFTSASGKPKSVNGCALIAAEGINSSVRKILYPEEGKPIYGGRILWRGTSLADPFLGGKTMFMAGHQDLKFVAYPISGVDNNNKVLLNWIAEKSVPDLHAEVQDWNKQVDTDKFSDAFSDWNFSWVDIPNIIASANKVYEFPLSDRDPLPKWAFGRLTLIGDAAHPMYPIGSNGASQGILDAEKLAIELGKNQSLFDTFSNYENERRPATASIVLSNRKNGPEQVMQLAHERAPEGFINIDQVISRTELEDIAAMYKQTAGFKVDAVNANSSRDF
ncbi:MAG: flavin-dependent oxidoreductase [Pseudomonadales bacterium]|nr:flavin-dependent oxidoreductase [Pseudomonadales bacterium]